MSFSLPIPPFLNLRDDLLFPKEFCWLMCLYSAAMVAEKKWSVSGLYTDCLSCFSSSFWSCMFPFVWALTGIWIQWPAASKAATVTSILYSCYGTHVPEKRLIAVQDLVFVLLLYVSSLHYVNMGATENSEIGHKTKINSRISAYGERKNTRGYPNIFLQCSLQVCGGFIAATWDFNSPKETGNLVQEFQWKKKKNLLIALEVSPWSTQAVLLRGWCHDQEVSCGEIY